MSTDTILEDYARELGKSDCLKRQIIELLIFEHLLRSGCWPSVKKITDLCRFAGYAPSANTVLKERAKLEESLIVHLRKSKFEKTLKDSSKNLREKSLKNQ